MTESFGEFRWFFRTPTEDPTPDPPPGGYVPLFGSSSPNVTDWRAKRDSYYSAVTRVFLTGRLQWSDPLLTHIVTNTTNHPVYVSFKTWSEDDVSAFLATPHAERTVFLSYHHEPEGDADITPQQFKDRNARVRYLWVQAGSPSNVKIVSTLQGFTYRTSTRDPADYYVDSTTGPDGETYKVFDILSCDQYDPGYKNKEDGVYSDFGSLNQDLVRFGKAKGLPIGFGEVGSPVGPHRTTDLVKRRAQIQGTIDWCLANAGPGPGQVMVVSYWDVTANKKWAAGSDEYAQWGAIPQADYSMDLNPPVAAKSPGTLAASGATYGGPDPDTPPIWKTVCALSHSYHGVD